MLTMCFLTVAAIFAPATADQRIDALRSRLRRRYAFARIRRAVKMFLLAW